MPYVVFGNVGTQYIVEYPERREYMNIQGLQKLTLLDFPGKVACTLFTYGCNFRCPFCHNSKLVTDSAASKIEEDEILSFLKKRQGIIDGVCISGGEPLLQDVAGLLLRIKEMGFLVKLDTNGAFPQRMKELAVMKLVDYVAMDIKNAPQFYEETAAAPVNMEDINESISFLMHGSIDFEFRTTVVREFHSEERLIEAARWIQGDERYFLQSFVDSGSLIQEGLHGFSKNEMERLAEKIRRYVPKTQLRGI